MLGERNKRLGRWSRTGHADSLMPTSCFSIIFDADRHVPSNPHLACPVKYEVYLTGVGEELQISVGAHSCAMNSRLKAAPTKTISYEGARGASLWIPCNFYFLGLTLFIFPGDGISTVLERQVWRNGAKLSGVKCGGYTRAIGIVPLLKRGVWRTGLMLPLVAV